eukprot:gene5792-340_t
MNNHRCLLWGGMDSDSLIYVGRVRSRNQLKGHVQNNAAVSMGHSNSVSTNQSASAQSSTQM